ncbi:Endonuclease/exonuclease/phosphatase domain-containing protein OS=Streptomyces fumanus OX=67302 GN=GCM10018772_65180 PE=4 SV=1 [Streptomyces fumanus]
MKSLPEDERYSYVYQGNSQVLDQILVSPAIRRGGHFTYDSVHVNAEFHDQISDHDPQVLRFRP